jgi:type VI secretion system protein ImpJ
MEKPLFWHQGLFLQPQHFQMEGLHTHSLLSPFFEFANPHFWGVGELSIQKAALGNRTFSLHTGEFIFPDMTHVQYPGNALVQPRSFEKDWTEGGTPLKILLGLRKWNPNGKNVTVVPALNDVSKITTRFASTADAEEIPDLHQDGPTAPIKRMLYVLKIFWESEIDSLGDYTLIPVAELVRTGEETARSKSFIPPSLTLSGTDILEKHIKEIRDEITARARQLEAYKKARGIHTAEFGARDMVYLLALRSLNRYVPVLHHLTGLKQVHPCAVYGMLRQLVGELSSFSEEVTVLGESGQESEAIPAYNHLQLGECFNRMHDMVIRLLDEITAGPEYMIVLSYDGTYFTADLLPAMFGGGNRYYLVLETRADPEPLLHSFETAGKLGTRESLPLLIARALPAIRVNHLAAPPQELPRRAFSLYFQIDNHSDLWTQVEKGNNLALYWDAAPEDLKVELMIVGRS